MCFEAKDPYESAWRPEAVSAQDSGTGQGCQWPVNRRAFVMGAAAVAGAAAMGIPAHAPAETAAEPPVKKLGLTITINGSARNLQIDPRTSLLDLLREELRLTGTKKGCDHGQCGACTVLVNGVRINSCLSLAIVHDGHNVTTVEGLAHGDELHPVQEAFLEHDGYQCGYCTPGQLCSAVAAIEEARKGMPSMVTLHLAQSGPIELTEDEVRERMSGNICRCGAYPGIVAAVQQASGQD